jgi:hypothetical protein
MRRLIIIGKLKGKKSMIVDLQAYRELKPERLGTRNREKPRHKEAPFGEAAEKGGNHVGIPQGGKKDE